MTSLDDVQQLQQEYGADWIVRRTNGKAYATRRIRSLTEDELRAGLEMTLYDGDGNTLAAKLKMQTLNEARLNGTASTEAALTPTP